MRNRVLRTTTVAVAVGAYLAAVFGFPMLRPVHKAADQAFPCQDHPCGCMTAEACWTNCCCFTKNERLAWAREHKVAAPATLGWHDARQRDAESAETSCSQSCCRSKAGCSHGCAEKKETGDPKRRVSWVLGSLAKKCRGAATLWLSLGCTAPPPPMTAWSYDWSPTDWLRPSSKAFASVSFSPATPPPRS